MKKGILILCFTAIVCQYGFSKMCIEKTMSPKKYSVEQLFNDFSIEKNTVKVKIGGFAMTLARLFTDTKGVSGIEVFSFDECDLKVKEQFNAAIKNIKDDTYDTLISTNENGEQTKVLLKIKDDCIHEIVVIAGGDDPALIKIKGKIKPDDVESVVENNKKK